MKRAYFEINGNRYYGYDFYVRSDSGISPQEYDIVVNEPVKDRLRTLEGLLDENYVPDDGAEIHVVPDCPICMDDIRKNYRIRRSPDRGKCNVFSPYRKGVRWSRSAGMTGIIPSLKVIVCDTQYNANKDTLNALIRSMVPNAVGIGPDQIIYVSNRVFYMGLRISDAYIWLLDGALRTPAISYKKLRLCHGNLLTPDALFMFYQAGMRNKYDANAERDFIMEASALNQTDWRDYPGTLSLLMNEILKRGDIIKEVVCRTKSTLPKAIRELLSVRPSDYAGSEDRKMASALVQEILDIREEKFTDIETLFGTMASKGISFQTFKSFYRNMVRIQPI